MGSGKYGMTIETSAALGTVTKLLGSGQYSSVKLGIGAFPVYSSSVQGGVEPGGSGVYISNKVPAVQQAAAWQYLSYLCNTQSQATWAAGTGYIPVRKSSAQTATVQHLWATDPGYKVAYNEINNGANTPATSGSVIGPYADVRTDILNAEISMYTGGASPASAVKTAEANVNSTISSYNSRLGASESRPPAGCTRRFHGLSPAEGRSHARQGLGEAAGPCVQPPCRPRLLAGGGREPGTSTVLHAPGPETARAHAPNARAGFLPVAASLPVREDGAGRSRRRRSLPPPRPLPTMVAGRRATAQGRKSQGRARRRTTGGDTPGDGTGDRPTRSPAPAPRAPAPPLEPKVTTACTITAVGGEPWVPSPDAMALRGAAVGHVVEERGW